MPDIFVYVVLGLVIVVNEIRLRRSKRKRERLESLWLQVVDLKTGSVVLNHSLKMLEELSRSEPGEYLYKGMVMKVYRQGEGG
ncbi:hypothetical protein ES703_14529 [subsurface metagenome]